MKRKIQLLAFMLCLCLITPITASAMTTKDSFYLSDTSLTMQIGNSKDLTLYNHKYEDILPYPLSYPCEYKSSNEKVVTVSEFGGMSAVGLGTATITARYDGMTFTCKVKVIASKFKLNKNKITTKTNLPVKLKMNHPDSIYSYYTSLYRYDHGLKHCYGFNIVDTEFDEDTGEITVTPQKSGTYLLQVFVDTDDNKTYMDSCTLTVSTHGLIEDNIGCAIDVTRQLTYGDLDNIHFSSDDPDILTVDEKGLITPVDLGEATVTMTGNNKNHKKETYECKVTVSDPKIEENYILFPANTYFDLNIKGRSQRTDDITYISSDPNILDTTEYLDGPYAKNPGIVDLTMIVDGKKFDLTVEVVNPQITEDSLYLVAGTKKKIAMTGVSATLKKYDISYSIDDSKIATVSKDGTITAKKNGFAVLTVDFGPICVEKGISVGTKQAITAVRNALHTIGDPCNEADRMGKGHHEAGSLIWKCYSPAGINFGEKKIAPYPPAMAKYLYDKKKGISNSVLDPKKLQPGDLIFGGLPEGVNNKQFRNINDVTIVVGISSYRSVYPKDYGHELYNLDVIGILNNHVQRYEYNSEDENVRLIARPTK